LNTHLLLIQFLTIFFVRKLTPNWDDYYVHYVQNNARFCVCAIRIGDLWVAQIFYNLKKLTGKEERSVTEVFRFLLVVSFGDLRFGVDGWDGRRTFERQTQRRRRRSQKRRWGSSLQNLITFCLLFKSFGSSMKTLVTLSN
jgi:hypothetical protein